MKTNNRQHRIGQAADKARTLFVACKISLRVYNQRLRRLERLQGEKDKMLIGQMSVPQMREWVKDCVWADIGDDADVDDLTDAQILKGVARFYDGGIDAFVRDSSPNAKVQP